MSTFSEDFGIRDINTATYPPISNWVDEIHNALLKERFRQNADLNPHSPVKTIIEKCYAKKLLVDNGGYLPF